MQQYFSSDYSGPPFELFGAGHLVVLGIILAILAYLVFGNIDLNEHEKRRMRLQLAWFILVVESSWHVWHLTHGTWDIQRHLPLHTCSIGIWGCIYMLFTRNYRLYEVFYFIGIAGATQALLTPNAGEFGLPHFRAVQTLASHGLLVIGMIYITTVEGCRPTWRSIWRTMVIANIYMVFVSGVNVMLGSNYMYTMKKPETASLFDVLGPWPWYLVSAEFLALALFTMLYMPFAISDRRGRAYQSAK